jgi:hypothetical protein
MSTGISKTIRGKGKHGHYMIPEHSRMLLPTIKGYDERYRYHLTKADELNSSWNEDKTNMEEYEKRVSMARPRLEPKIIPYIPNRTPNKSATAFPERSQNVGARDAAARYSAPEQDLYNNQG